MAGLEWVKGRSTEDEQSDSNETAQIVSINDNKARVSSAYVREASDRRGS